MISQTIKKPCFWTPPPLHFRGLRGGEIPQIRKNCQKLPNLHPQPYQNPHNPPKSNFPGLKNLTISHTQFLWTPPDRPGCLTGSDGTRWNTPCFGPPKSGRAGITPIWTPQVGTRWNTPPPTP